MKKKVHHIGVIKDSDIKKKIRKTTCPPTIPMVDKTSYKRKTRNNKQQEIE